MQLIAVVPVSLLRRRRVTRQLASFVTCKDVYDHKMYGMLRVGFSLTLCTDESQGAAEDGERSMVPVSTASHHAGCWDSGAAVGRQFQYFGQFRSVLAESTAAGIRNGASG